MSDSEQAKTKDGRFHWSRQRVNENLGLILTGIASIAAALAWNEARLTRKDAHEDAVKSSQIQRAAMQAQIDEFQQTLRTQAADDLRRQKYTAYGFDLQKASVDAQIRSLEMDQRPFLRVSGVMKYDKSFKVIRMAVRLGIAGKTPAVNVKGYIGGKEADDFEYLKVSEVRKWMESFDMSKPWTQAVINPNEAEFEIPIRSLFHEDKEMIFYGFLLYEDLFGNHHKTEFCYYGRELDASLYEGSVVPSDCPSFVPKIS